MTLFQALSGFALACAIGISVGSISSFSERFARALQPILIRTMKIVATGTGAPALLALKRGDIAAWMSWDTAVAELENRGMEFIECPA